MSAATALPDVGSALRPVLARLAPEDRPLLIAMAERMAAERYRGWAAHVDDTGRRAGLLACAAREEEIAGRVESLYPDSAARQARIRQAVPDLVALTDEIFGERPLADQLAIQAAGERLGAATWRALAETAGAEATRAAFLACAPLEEASAEYLESLLDSRR
jgi:hypothetical protein